MLLPYMLLLLWFVTAAAVVAASRVHGEGQPHQQLPAPFGRRHGSSNRIEGRLPNFSSMRRLSEDEMTGRGSSKLIRGVMSASKRVGTGWVGGWGLNMAVE